MNEELSALLQVYQGRINQLTHSPHHYYHLCTFCCEGSLLVGLLRRGGARGDAVVLHDEVRGERLLEHDPGLRHKHPAPPRVVQTKHGSSPGVDITYIYYNLISGP